MKQIRTALIEHKANINARTVTGMTPLFYAVINYNDDAVEFLVERGADQTMTAATDKGQKTPREAAAVVKTLVDETNKGQMTQGGTPGYLKLERILQILSGSK